MVEIVRNGAVCMEGVAFTHNPHVFSSILLLAGFLQGPFTSSRKGPPSIHIHIHSFSCFLIHDYVNKSYKPVLKF